MPFNPDIVTGTLQDLESGYTENMMRSMPFLAYMLGDVDSKTATGRIKAAAVQGYIKEFGIVTNGPGAMVSLTGGDENLPSVQRTTGAKGNQYSALMAYFWSLNGRDLHMSGSKNDMMELIESYPETALDEMKQIINRQILCGYSSAGVDPVGNGTGAVGLLTLNGLHNYNPNGDLRRGVFQFVDKTLQTATVFNQPLQGAPGLTGWYHQHKHIGSFSGEGMKAYRDVVRVCNAQGRKMGGKGVELAICDPATWNNMLQHHDGMITIINDANYPLAKYLGREGFRVGNVDWWADDEFDLTNPTVWDGTAGGLNARLGVCYLLSPDFWALMYQNQHPDKMGTGFFDFTQEALQPNAISWQFRIIADFNFFCRSLRNQASFTGGAQD
jgi:hypothetical protein